MIKYLKSACFILILTQLCIVSVLGATTGTLFEGRDIALRPQGAKIFKAGFVDIDAAEKNFFPLNKRKSLDILCIGQIGYYEKIHERKSTFINNHPLIRIIKSSTEPFRIEFTYKDTDRNIGYRLITGEVNIYTHETEGYPTLTISSAKPPTDRPLTLNTGKRWVPAKPRKIELCYNGKYYPMTKKQGDTYSVTLNETQLLPENVKVVVNSFQYDCETLIGNEILLKKKKLLFFDLNNQNDYLKKYYYMINREITSPNSKYYAFLYYYTSDDYERDSFKIHQRLSGIKKELMGSSPEEKSIPYYINIIKELNGFFGRNTMKDITIVSRYGTNKISNKIRNALRDQGSNVDLRLISYKNFSKTLNN